MTNDPNYAKRVRDSLHMLADHAELPAMEAFARVGQDGFVGNIIGYYVTHEGNVGLVLQHSDSKVVHVYRDERVTVE